MTLTTEKLDEIVKDLADTTRRAPHSSGPMNVWIALLLLEQHPDPDVRKKAAELRAQEDEAVKALNASHRACHEFASKLLSSSD